MDKVIYYNSLLGLYKGLLTENEKEIFSLYYEENYSMGEIAYMKGITRSAVGKYISTVEKKLDNYEKELKINEKSNILRKLLDESDTKIIKNGIQSVLD